MKVVYLDQNKWIDLTKAYHGKTADKHLKVALEFAKDASRRNIVTFPLSAIHYMETAKIRDSERRDRLGAVMWEISQGYTLVSYRDLVRYELEVALARRFSHISPRPFQYISKGFAHAFRVEYPGYRLPESLRSNLPKERRDTFERAAQRAMERAAITGKGPDNIVMPAFRTTTYKEQFKQHLETLHPRISQLPPSEWDDALQAIALADIRDPINEVLQYHQLDQQRPGLLGNKEDATALLNELPSRQVEIQMHRQVLKNPHLKPRNTDLEDWSGLGPAAAHCDVVICEKHFADLLLRDGFQPKARILTDVRRLHEVG